MDCTKIVPDAKPTPTRTWTTYHLQIEQTDTTYCTWTHR